MTDGIGVTSAGSSKATGAIEIASEGDGGEKNGLRSGASAGAAGKDSDTFTTAGIGSKDSDAFAGVGAAGKDSDAFAGAGAAGKDSDAFAGAGAAGKDAGSTTSIRVNEEADGATETGEVGAIFRSWTMLATGTGSRLTSDLVSCLAGTGVAGAVGCWSGRRSFGVIPDAAL
jgi:hypothetical protein